MTAKPPIAALLGAFVVFLIGAGIDWMWELTAVTVAGTAVLALLVGPATLARSREAGPRLPAAARRRLGVAVLAAVACAIVVAEAIVLLVDVEVRASQADVRAGRLASARAHAVAATRIEPWAASAHLQLALVDARIGRLVRAREEVAAAIRRDSADWRPWFAASQIDARLGRSAAAADDRARARSLNPRSLLLPPAG